MNKQSKINKKAWSYRATEFWSNKLGKPSQAAKDMIERPHYYLRRHIQFFDEIRGKKIINPLGSCGQKAVPLAILGADVTVVDISEENKKYATDIAVAANVNLTYIVSDFLEFNIDNIHNPFDIAYLEGGVLHYFSDLHKFANKLYSLLKLDGKLILNDFHPFRKLLQERDIFKDANDNLELTGNYFESELIVGEVSYEKYLSHNTQDEFPKCLLRYWTMGEIITAFASAGFVIKQLVEGPRFDSYKNLPGDFTLIALKQELAEK
ncbi:class I SAM-dependent methyltransferase [Vallitalea pronyensis]|uniref:Class I SAM-dependent methyltransferase n=1 Tax=Vallitalea pronyensis TaxID=1348613 RepID=A0A8J8SI38_9FIRM|nr:methyltransferase domain-containing protein [Vallitalea pronyensis]QUI24206.1 class I SAM-dependent methyltransferase [Vallitalea pronyensis]